MRTCCPECDAAIELEDSTVALLTCPSCGTRLGMSEGDMLTETVSMKSGGYEMVAHFELLRKVGSGTFGDVFQARDTQLDRIVAVKLLRRGIVDDQSRAMFLREGRSAAHLRHPQIVSVYGLGSDGDTCYIVSEFIEGVPLSKYLQSRRFEPREAAELCAGIADALAHAHAAGVIHRDLKPSNIMLDGQRRPHVMDFGLAKRETGDVTLTVDGQLLGTVPYMPPEQASGKAHQADRRSDIYSLGVVLYELLTGSYPFRGSTESILFQILHDEPAPPRKANPAVPRDLETICLKALSKDPAHRYDSAQEMAADLRAFLAGAPIKARAVGRLERAWRWTRRKPLAAAASTTIIVLAAGIFGLYRQYHVARHANDPKLRTVRVETIPPGARAVFVPLDRYSGEPLAAGKVKLKGVTPGQLQLAPGDYLVVVDLANYGFHEVYRHLPDEGEGPGGGHPSIRWTELAEGVIALETVTIVPTATATKGMEYFPGGEFLMGDKAVSGAPEHRRTVPAYWLDRTEVTAGQFRSVMHNLPEQPMGNGADAPQEDYPVTNVTFRAALSYAEKVGKRIMTEAEYEFAATDGGTQRYPWGDSDEPLGDWPFGPVGEPAFDRLSPGPPVVGLYSNVAEWTESRGAPYPGAGAVAEELRRLVPLSRVIRGGTHDVMKRAADSNRIRHPSYSGPRYRMPYTETLSFPGVGFRCARSAAPRFLDD